MDLIDESIPIHHTEVSALFKLWVSGVVDKRNKLFLSRTSEAGVYSVASAKKYRDISTLSLHYNKRKLDTFYEKYSYNSYKIEIRGTEVFCNRTYILDISKLFKRVSYEIHTRKLNYPFIGLSKNIVGELYVSKFIATKRKDDRSPVYAYYKLIRHTTDFFRGKVINYLEKNIKDYRTIYEYILQSQIDTWEKGNEISYIITNTDFGGIIKTPGIYIKYCNQSAQNPNNTQYYKERLFMYSLLRGHNHLLPAHIFPYNLLRHCKLPDLDIKDSVIKKIEGNILIVSWSNPGWARWLAELLIQLPKVKSVTPFCLFL